MKLRRTAGWRVLAPVTLVIVSVLLSCGQAATPSPTAAPLATATKAPTVAPTATVVAAATASPSPVGAVPTTTATSPAPTATQPASQTPTPGSKVFGQFNIDPTKAGIKYLSNKPDFSLPPKRGGILKISNTLVWPHFDVSKASVAGILGPLAPVYSRLVVCKGVLEMASPNTLACEAGPELAQSWEISADGKVWTFHLAKGIKWQNLPPVNGREFTSADVKYTVDLYSKGGPRATGLDMVEKLDTPDTYTVRFTLKKAYPDFIYTILADKYFFMLPHEIADRDGDFSKVAVGTGPFQIKQLMGKERIIYERNPNYFVPSAPILDGIDYTIIIDNATQRAAFRAGQLHLNTGDNMTPADVPAFQPNTSNVTLFSVDQSLYFMFYVRMDKAPFNNVQVRRAVSLAIDRPGLMRDIWQGEASITAPIPWQYMYDSAPTLDQMPYYKYDPAQAKQLLAAAGYANGFSFKANYYAYTAVKPQMPFIIDELKAVGINLELIQQDNTSFNSTLNNGSYDSAIIGYAQRWSSLDGWLYGNMYSGSPNNSGRIKDADLDKLLQAQQVELNPDKRKEIARTVYQMELQKVWRIPLVGNKVITYHSTKLHNYVFSENLIAAYSLENTLNYLWVD